MRIRFLCCCAFILILFSSCKITKFVPDGEYLLDKVEIQTENAEVKRDELNRYLRQKPNSSVFGIWRMQLRIYSTAGKDSTKWINRVLMRTGEAPVIYDSVQTFFSQQQLRQVMQNKGYMHAEVSSSVEYKKKKAKVTYYIDENAPYRLRNYTVNIPQEVLREIATDAENTLIRENMLFDVHVFDAERERITEAFRAKGYYKFNKEYLVYTADSALNTNRIDLSLYLREFSDADNDSIYKEAFTQYYIRNVIFLTSRNLGIGSSGFNADAIDTERAGNYYLVSDENKFLKMRALLDNTFITTDRLFNDNMVQRTYTALNNLPPVKYVNVNFREVAKDSLDCLITIAPAKEVSLSAEIEATYTDGYWGAAANIGAVHRNVFRGAESLSLQARMAVEKQKEVWARELGLQTALRFPNFLMPFTTSKFRRNIRATTEFGASASYQDRPSEFTVTNVGIGMKYGWTHFKYHHSLELIDISYVDFDVEKDFWDEFIESNKFNRYNYTDHLITRIGYTGAYTTFNPLRPLKNTISLRYSIETAGNLLYGINKLFGGKKNEDSCFTIINIPYSQYVRADFNITYHQIIDENNRFVYHFGLGVGTPYGNADVIPYERRYFSGGANSVRGWSESTLGPGTYSRDETIRGRDYNQVGDIKLDINAEYRFKMFRSLDEGLFVDAGNIWTIKDYETQEGGKFEFKSFLSQLGVAYGIGLRLDISFVVIRLDLGVKLHNPILPRSERWRTNPKSEDFALHFAIGYPF